MIPVSKTALKVLAGAVWLGGAVHLLTKAARMFSAADALSPDNVWSWAAVVVAVLIGGIKAHYLFSRFCRRNLDRIAALERPQFWQAFRPQFYVLLMLMILFGVTVTRLAVGSYPGTIGVVMLDISIGVALLGSFRMFWTHSTA